MSDPKKRQDPLPDPIFDVEQVASATECTGLMPAQIQSAEQGESLSKLESIHRIHPRFVDGNDEK